MLRRVCGLKKQTVSMKTYVMWIILRQLRTETFTDIATTGRTGVLLSLAKEKPFTKPYNVSV